MYLNEHPDLLQCINTYMASYRQGERCWTERDFYPVGECLCKGFKGGAEAVLLVDVGGDMGHDLEEFKAKEVSGLGREADPAEAGGDGGSDSGPQLGHRGDGS
jgi:hypothetical protein